MTDPPTQLCPCGILCGSCPLGSGSVADSAASTRQHIADCQIPMWSPFVPGGEAIVLGRLLDRALDWMTTYARCAGCRNGGGPPDCARERDYELCSSCPNLVEATANLDGCGIKVRRLRIT